MTIEGAYRLLAEILERLPEKYPRPRMVLHESAEALIEHLCNSRSEFHISNGYPPALVMAVAESERNAIHIPYTTLRESDKAIFHILLHEIGHLYYSAKHGHDSPQSFSEPLAESFAKRWKKRLLVRVEDDAEEDE